MTKMTLVLFLYLFVNIASQGTYAAITATESDFEVDCGTDVGGPLSVKYTNPDPGTNPVVKMSSPGNKATCAATGNSGVFTISDARTNCDINQLDPAKPEYAMQVVLQEYDSVYQKSDPVFVFKCSYIAGSVNVTTFIPDGGLLGSPIAVDKTAISGHDMVYSIEVSDSNQAPVTKAAFGDNLVLRVTMNGTDDDEKGIKVKSCAVKSGTVSLPIIENFCVPADKVGLFKLTGFNSAPLSAAFPIQLFALEGSDTKRVDFECVINICPSSCNGPNCETPPGKRKRRAAGDESAEDKTVKMVTSIEILSVGTTASDQQNGQQKGQQNGQQDSSPTMCVKSLGFILTVTVLAVLLLVAMVAMVYLLTTRRRELQKQGA
ncbi:uncharacterized protein LOC135480804 isoform X2 [Liolophura sinensis]|uniref:uncharacterized protein LOC135480804 isoform X2 n=1 Tax=Liolophura sinensis TaxID=3198878 RepID=UPI0031596834